MSLATGSNTVRPANSGTGLRDNPKRVLRHRLEWVRPRRGFYQDLPLSRSPVKLHRIFFVLVMLIVLVLVLRLPELLIEDVVSGR